MAASDAPVAVDPVTFDDPQADELSGRVLRGLGWKLFSQLATQGTRLAVGITLARLLTPHQFGLAAMALVISAFVISFADVGLGAALVQRRTLSDIDCSTAFWASVIAGVTLSVAGFLAAPLVADFYGNHEVSPLVAVICLSFAITALGTTHRSLLFRAMDFKNLELRLVIGTLAGGATAVILAAAGYGPWAFVGSELALASVSTILVWSVLPWRPNFAFSWSSLRDLGGYGIRAFGGATFQSLSRNADNILIGRYIGAFSLGLYAFAYNLMLASLTRIVLPVQQVIFPALSRLQDDRARLAEFWIRSTRVVAAISAPLLAAVIITAPDLVPLVFGSHWKPAVPLVQILCWAGLVDCLVALNDVVLKAQDAVKVYFRYTLGALVVNLAAFVVGLHWGVKGVAGAFAVSTTILGIAYTGITARRSGVSAREVGRALGGVGYAVAGMSVVCLVTRELLLRADTPVVVRVVVCLELAVAAYLVLVRAFAAEVVDEMREVSGLRQGKAVAA